MAARVAFRDGWTCSCVATSLPWVEADMTKRGIISNSIDIFQLGWRGDVSASAGTHDEGGCTDVGQWSTAAIQVWREWGWTMQRRDLSGIKTHGHGWPWGCSHLAPAGQNQADDWARRRNGLASHGPIAGMWPVKPWNEALEDGIMSLIDDIAEATADKVIARRGSIADAVTTRELKLSDKSEDAIADRVIARVFNEKVIPTWREAPAGGWPAGEEPGPWALHSLLRSIRQEVAGSVTGDDLEATKTQLDALSKKIDAIAAAVAAKPVAVGAEGAAEDPDPAHDYLKEDQ